MINYPDFYRATGIIKPEYLLDPRIIKADTFIFPNESILYYLKIADNEEYVSDQTNYLKREKLVTVMLRTKFCNLVKSKELILRDININDILKEQTKKAKKFKLTKPDLPGGKTNGLMIYNYGLLNYLYGYDNINLTQRNETKFNNVIRTVIEDINTNSRYNNYITIDLTNDIIPYTELKVLTESSFTQSDWYKLQDNKKPIIVWLFQSLFNKGPFSEIKENIRTKTTFLLIYIDKVVQINLQFLYDLVNSKFNLEVNKAFDLLYILLYQIYKGKTLDYKKIEQNGDKLFDKVFLLKEAKKYSNIVKVEDIIKDITEDDDIVELNMDTDIDDEFHLSKLELSEAKYNKAIERVYENIEGLYKDSVIKCFENDPIAELEYLKERKAISTTQYKKYLSAYEEQKKLKNPYFIKNKKSGEVISNILDFETDDFKIKDTDKSINDSVIIFNKKYNQDVISAINKKYLLEQYHKDIIRSIYALNRVNEMVLSYDIEETIDIMGGMETHIIEILGLDGKKTKLKIALPIINEDGTFKLYGNPYIFRKQRTDMPIRKIANTKVGLNSYYGKLFIYKGINRMFNVSKWFSSLLTKLQKENKDFSNVIVGEYSLPDVELPLLYCQIGREIKSFRYKGYEFNFDFTTRFELCPGTPLETIFDIEDTGYILTGVELRTGNLMFMDFNSNLYIQKGKKLELLDNFFLFLEIDNTTMPIEHATINILKENVPVCVVLSYYLGLQELLKLLKVKYTFISGKTRQALENNQYSIRFSDGLLVIDKDNGLGDMVLGGFTGMARILKNIPMSDFNTRKNFGLIFSQIFPGLKSTVRYETEIDLLEKMYIDPMTLNVLKYLKQPQTFSGMILYSCELLLNDSYKHPNNIDEMIVKGYERIAGIVYNTLIKVLKDYYNQSAFTKSTIKLDEYEILRRINEDNTKVIVDDLNPMAMLKQKEDMTLLGMGGRAKETLVKRTREVHISEIGITSEATKDSTDVGVTAYLSAAPQIDNTLGVVINSKERDNEWVNMLSTAGMLTVFGRHDDAKRLNFSSIMSSHIVPMTNSRTPYVLEGYETILPIKARGKFVSIADDDGEVIELTKDKITVNYRKLGKASYSLKSWRGKEESGTCYTHNIVPNLKVGQKFLKDDTIAYDEAFFAPCIFEPRRVIYKQGTIIKVMFSEEVGSHEDSTIISYNLHKKLGTKLTKVKSIIVNAKDNINNVIDVNEKVKPETSLLTITSGDLVGKNEGLDKESLALLNEIKQASPKAETTGVVSHIVVYYNLDNLKEASNTIKKLIEYSDNILLKEYGYPGKVTSKYSVDGKPLLPGEIQIKFYIETNNNMGNGDKLIYGNQLKCTIGEVFDYELITDDGEEIDAIFSNRSVAARNTLSPYLTGTTGTLLNRIEQNIIDMYFK